MVSGSYEEPIKRYWLFTYDSYDFDSIKEAIRRQTFDTIANAVTHAYTYPAQSDVYEVLDTETMRVVASGEL